MHVALRDKSCFSRGSIENSIPLCIYGDSASSRHDTRHRTQNRVPLLNGIACVARSSTHTGSYQKDHTRGRKEASLRAGRNAKCALRVPSDEATSERSDRNRLDNKSPRANGWRMSACTRDYFDGASQRAKERGYRLETLWLSEPGMSGQRMSNILWTRGIHGVLLPPQEALTSIDLDWDSLSSVTFGYTLLQPRCTWCRTTNTERWARCSPSWKNDSTNGSAW